MCEEGSSLVTSSFLRCARVRPSLCCLSIDVRGGLYFLGRLPHHVVFLSNVNIIYTLFIAKASTWGPAQEFDKPEPSQAKPEAANHHKFEGQDLDGAIASSKRLEGPSSDGQRKGLEWMVK